MATSAGAQGGAAWMPEQADCDDTPSTSGIRAENDALASLERFAEVAHDLMNLLTVVSCHAELMRDRHTDAETTASLNVILDAVDRASDLNHDLLTSGKSVWSRLATLPRLEAREHDVDSTTPH